MDGVGFGFFFPPEIGCLSGRRSTPDPILTCEWSYVVEGAPARTVAAGRAGKGRELTQRLREEACVLVTDGKHGRTHCRGPPRHREPVPPCMEEGGQREESVGSSPVVPLPGLQFSLGLIVSSTSAYEWEDLCAA